MAEVAGAGCRGSSWRWGQRKPMPRSVFQAQQRHPRGSGLPGAADIGSGLRSEVYNEHWAQRPHMKGDISNSAFVHANQRGRRKCQEPLNARKPVRCQATSRQEASAASTTWPHSSPTRACSEQGCPHRCCGPPAHTVDPSP